MRLLLTISLLLSFGPKCRAQYNAPGLDTAFGKYQPNPYARVSNGVNLYPTTPARKEYYTSVAHPDSFAAILTYNRGLQAGTIAGGKMITPTEHLMGVPRGWRKGMNGQGVKICVIDEGYPGNVSHQAISITDTFGLNPEQTYNHTTQIIGVIAARNNDSSKMLGIAYESPIYVAGLGNTASKIRWALAHNVRVILISSAINYDTSTVAAVAEAHYAGAVVVVAAGNDLINHTVPDTMQQGCRIPWTVCVGSLLGGGPWVFVDSFYTKQILPYGNKGLDFALPVNTIAPSFDTVDGAGFPIAPAGHNNSYRIVGGTSFTAPQVAALIALLMQRYPRLSGRAIYHMLKYYARPVTSNGITTRIPNLLFIR